MAVATSAILGGLAAVGAAVGAAASVKQASDQKKQAKVSQAMAVQQQKEVLAQQKETQKQLAANKIDVEAENKKAAMAEAEANRKRAAMQSDTIQTTALGNTEATATKKKTLLGG